MFKYTGIVSEITGNFRFVLVDIETECDVKIYCDIYYEHLKNIVNLLDVGEKISIRGKIKSRKTNHFNHKTIIKVNVFEIIG